MRQLRDTQIPILLSRIAFNLLLLLSSPNAEAQGEKSAV
jgi:hypothetical protein